MKERPKKTALLTAVLFTFISFLLCVEPTLSAPAASNSGSEEGLVLQLVINDEEMQDFVEGFEKHDKLYLPLGQLSSLLDFAIKVDAAHQTAEGWFIHDNNKIAITEKTAEVKGKKYDIPPGSMISKDQDLFVDSTLLQKWLPLDFSADLKRLVLDIHSREALPAQEAQQRKKMHEVLEQQKGQKGPEKKTMKLETPYAAAQWPTVDLTFSPSYLSTSKQRRSDYSALAVGDLGYLTTHMYAAGNLSDPRPISDLRLNFGRTDYEGNLLGPLRATSFMLGDINSISLGGALSPGQGRGVTLTNRSLDRPDKFDVTSFIGDSKPGWDVELYRNDILISFKVVGDDGRYIFKDIPVLFGSNVFRLEFYGPQGQRENLVKTINASSTLLEKGKFAYNFSADQKQKTLAGISDAHSTDSGMPRMAGEVEYGLTRNITATGGGAHTTIDGIGHDYATAGLHSSLRSVLAALDNAYDTTNHGRSSKLSLSSRLLDTDIQLQQKLAENFFVEGDTATTDTVTSQTDLSLNRQFDIPLFGFFSNDALLTKKQYTSGRREDLVVHRLSKTFLEAINATNTLQYDHDDRGLDQLKGNLNLRGNYDRIELGAIVDYDARPLKQFNSVKLTALMNVKPGVTDNATVTRQLTGTTGTQLENTTTFDLRHFKLSVTGRANDKAQYYAGISINTSLSRIPSTGKIVASSQPLAEAGTVVVIPYLDHNYNQKYDPGEKILYNTMIKIGSQNVKTDKNGVAIATQLPVNVPIRIGMDQDKQENPYLMASSEYRVVPRSGRVIEIHYPLAEMSQIDGAVHVPAGSNPASLQVDLINTEGQIVNSTHTAYDGYYLIEGVMPGSYKIRIAKDGLAARHLQQTEERDISIKESDFYVRDITLDKERLKKRL
ncbi:MAG: carboxypeptidase regulatory-like domain-containing protein [Proteobacteria bacterium]|nr:carboxypeptidase regulatory-like domain-containing protein [Pseudomonadota bacterium]